MSLLWFDGLGGYPETTPLSAMGQSYTVNEPVVARVAGRNSTSYSVRIEGGGYIEKQVTNTDATAIVGFAYRINYIGAVTRQPLISFYSGATEQVRVLTTVTAGTHIFEFCRVEGGNVVSVLGATAAYPNAQWRYGEMRVNFSLGGGIEWRVGGTREMLMTGATDSSTPLGWNKVRFACPASMTLQLADLYILNTDNGVLDPKYANFLGPISCSTLIPDASRWLGPSDWTIRPNGTKTRMVVLAGQSNMNGYSTAPGPVPAGVTSPNPYVQIWDRISGLAGTPNFQSLILGTNNNNAFAAPAGNFFGPEMSFADSISDYYTKLASTTPPTSTVFVKCAKNDTSLYPHPVGDMTWDPNTPGNLYSGGATNLATDIVQAATALGGFGNVQRIDFFWYQGETDAIYSFSSQAYIVNLYNFLETIRIGLAALAPSTEIKFYVVRIHKDLTPLVFPYRDAVRNWQNILVYLFPQFELIDIDDVPISTTDYTHFNGAGYTAIGRKLFAAWIKNQNEIEEIDDQGTSGSDGDQTYMAANANNSDLKYLLKHYAALRGSAIQALRLSVVGKSEVTAEPVKPLFESTAGTSITLPTSYTKIDQTLLTNPATGRPFLEEFLESGKFGFRTIAP